MLFAYLCHRFLGQGWTWGLIYHQQIQNYSALPTLTKVVEFISFPFTVQTPTRAFYFLEPISWISNLWSSSFFIYFNSMLLLEYFPFSLWQQLLKSSHSFRSYPSLHRHRNTKLVQFKSVFLFINFTLLMVLIRPFLVLLKSATSVSLPIQHKYDVGYFSSLSLVYTNNNCKLSGALRFFILL